MRRIGWLGLGLAATLALALPTTANAATTSQATSQKAPQSVSSTAVKKQDLAAGTTQDPYVRTPALAVTNRGTTIAAYDPRPTGDDLPSNMSLVVRRSHDDGKTWGPTQVVRSSPAPDGFSDPSLLVDHTTGRIFLFYAASVNEGYSGSATGNSDTDPNILQADVSYSDDNGATWKNEVITSQIKDPAWNGIFAASGEGIQLTTGEHAGRLVQQYVVGYDGGEYAASAYSDDNGASWKMGALVGPGMNENKTVQLANGNVLLDVRDAPNRLLATSTDGGETYSTPVANSDLPDPSDNGSIIRYAPTASAQNPQSQWLLESNNDSTSTRSNLVVKLSCDNGKTWPVTRVVEPGSAGYSTLTNLPDGRFGLLYERNNYTEMTYASFSATWVNGACGELSGGAAAATVSQSSTSVPVTLTDTGAAALAAGTVAITPPTGWTTRPVSVPALQPGWSLTIPVPVTLSSSASTGILALPVTYRSRSGQSQGVVPVTALVASPVWSTTGPLTADGVHASDESSGLASVSGLSGGTIAITFSTTQSAAAATLLSAANTTSNDQDLVVSLNSGAPYVEVRTATSTYPVRISTTTPVNDGRLHTLTVTSSASSTTIGLDGTIIGTATSGAFFSAVPELTNLTLGANVAAVGTRWQFSGTIQSAAVYR
ncbi:exo-alpha-sialidase [Frondihabitans sp. PAMC 28766]|uniref:sialidase family protein n=1 Tax=Frondihabitans sp. PAMC 28766 TaxID=1795630 RepID=UPI0009E76C3C|nr:sialidase family protein [Frondihabitans sp. PAMC 28766]